MTAAVWEVKAPDGQTYEVRPKGGFDAERGRTEPPRGGDDPGLHPPADQRANRQRFRDQVRKRVGRPARALENTAMRKMDMPGRALYKMAKFTIKAAFKLAWAVASAPFKLGHKLYRASKNRQAMRRGHQVAPSPGKAGQQVLGDQRPGPARPAPARDRQVAPAQRRTMRQAMRGGVVGSMYRVADRIQQRGQQRDDRRQLRQQQRLERSQQRQQQRQERRNARGRGPADRGVGDKQQGPRRDSPPGRQRPPQLKKLTAGELQNQAAIKQLQNLRQLQSANPQRTSTRADLAFDRAMSQPQARRGYDGPQQSDGLRATGQQGQQRPGNGNRRPGGQQQTPGKQPGTGEHTPQAANPRGQDGNRRPDGNRPGTAGRQDNTPAKPPGQAAGFTKPAQGAKTTGNQQQVSNAGFTQPKSELAQQAKEDPAKAGRHKGRPGTHRKTGRGRFTVTARTRDGGQRKDKEAPKQREQNKAPRSQ